MNCSTPGLPVHHQLPGFTETMSIESVMPSSHLILCRPLLLLPPIPPSIRVFSNESTLCMRWPKDWSLSFSIIPSKEIPGLISFRMDWLDLLALKQHKSLLIMEGKCLKCRYHELVVNFVCQLRLSYAVAANSPRISVAYDHRGLSLSHTAFPLQVSRGFVPCHLYSVTHVEGVGSSVMCQSKEERKFCSKAALLFTCLCQSKSCDYSRIQ